MLIGAGATAHAQSFADRAEVCWSCHGDKGQSQTPDIPSLGGQPAPYLLIQLYLFREKQRDVPMMIDLIKGFTDDDLRLFSDNLAKLPPPLPSAEASDPARIAAQREDYLLKTLREYKSNIRHGYDAAMAEVLATVTDAQIVDLAYTIARFR